MIRVLAIGAVLAWAVGAVTMPVAAWTWLRAGRRRWMLIAFAGGLVAQAGWVYEVAVQGLHSVVDPATDVGMTGWTAWALGAGGVAGLVSGTRRAPEAGLVSRPDRALELGLGFLGLGVLLQQIARAL